MDEGGMMSTDNPAYFKHRRVIRCHGRHGEFENNSTHPKAAYGRYTCAFMYVMLRMFSPGEIKKKKKE